MDKSSRIPSGLKQPSRIRPELKAKRDVRMELPPTSSKQNVSRTPTSAAAAIVARKARRSKTFNLTIKRKSISLKRKESNLNATKVGVNSRFNVKPAAPTVASRVNTGMNKTIAPSRIAAKRPAVPEASSTTSVSAPKFAKYDFKGRFTYLDEKHKELVQTYKAAKARLEELEEANKNFEQITKEQEIQLEELSTYKVSNKDFINQLRAAKEQNIQIRQEYKEAKNHGEALQAKLTLVESTHAQLTNDYDNLSAQNVQVKQTLDTLQMNHSTLQQNHQMLQESYKQLNDNFVLLQEKCQHAESKVVRLTDDLKVAHEAIDDYKDTLRGHETLRRKLHNDVQDLKGTIRVFCRVRPLQPDEEDKLPCNLNYLDECTLELKKSRESTVGRSGTKAESRLEFNFDRVFPEESTQAEVFEDLAQLVQSTLDGYNVCVFAYGQTGSGKTFTMLGDDQNLGMIPRSIDLLFTRIKELEKCGWTYEVQVNFIEIYNETIKDLLNPNSDKPHDIMYNEGKGSVVTNLRTETVATAGQVKKFMMLANRNRAVAATDFNLHSSRSHAVTKISVKGYFEQKEYSGSLNLVDLAGSESAKTSERMVETKSINKSLSALGTVMLSLFNKDGHVPYRNSKLTYLLQSSLGGNSKTLMFVNIAPIEDCYAECVNSLRFAAKVKEVKTGSKRNNKFINKLNL